MQRKCGIDDLSRCQLHRPAGYPSEERIAKGPVAIVECYQEIPCNPCETDCLKHAITVGTPITQLPVLDEDKCSGCGRCVPRCPGLAIVLVDATYSDKEAILGLPYEYLPYPRKGQEITLVNRSGNPVGKGRVVRISRPVDRTLTVYVAIPKSLIHEARGIQRLK
jgi:Fe-S-cluster-containing hydrogenase component 2